MEYPELMPELYQRMMECGKVSREQAACDYIAGMTDTYAIQKFEEYFIPESWKN